MPIVIGQGGPNVMHTGQFGPVPIDPIDPAAEIDRLAKSAGSIFERCISSPLTDEALRADLNGFRTTVGTLWVRLTRDIDRDTEAAYLVTKSFWRCMVVSLFTEKLHPLKYYETSGKPNHGYSALVVQLANMPTGGTPWRDAMMKEWGMARPEDHVNQVWETMNLLKRKESEYRAAANIVLQVGIGWGGMILGLIGMLLGILIPLLPMLFHKGG